MAVCLLVQTLYWVASPLCLSHLIDEGILKGQESVLWSVLTVLLVITISGNLAGIVFDWLSAGVLSKFLRGLRADMFAHLQRMSLGYFSRTSEGEIVARFSTDVATVEDVVESFIPWVLMPALAAIASTIALFQMDWRLALLSMLVWPSSLLGPRISAARALTASEEKRESEEEVLTQLQENISSQQVVKAFVLQKHSVEAFEKQNEQLAKKTKRMHFLSNLVDRSSGIGNSSLQLVVLGASALLAFRGEVTVGELTAFQALFLVLGSNVDYVTQYIPTLIRSSAGIKRIDALLRTPPDIVDRENALEHVEFKSDLSLDNVTFSYDGSLNNLEEVQLTIQKEQYVAFVGPSGCGKSTVLSLLMRMYDPNDGSVRLDGRDIRDIRLDGYRSLLAPVLQDSLLFNMSIRENIRMGCLDATDAEVEAAARAAEIAETIEQMPEGYDTIVGFRGGRLSGGQRQRLAIARALLRNPAILILDEATSALDPATEAAINDTLFRVSGTRSVVSVTHRLSSVVKCDSIFVLKEGRLVEQGTHDELLQAKGVYNELWNKQSGFTIGAQGGEVHITLERLRRIPLLSELSSALLEKLSEDLQTVRVPTHHTVLQQGDPGDKFYIIARGQVAVTKVGGSGEERTLARLQDGDYFGELALLRDVPRATTIRTIGPAIFLTLTRKKFQSLIGQMPEFREALEREYPD